MSQKNSQDEEFTKDSKQREESKINQPDIFDQHEFSSSSSFNQEAEGKATRPDINHDS